MITEVKDCRACGCPISYPRVFSLPEIYPSAFFKSWKTPAEWPKVPLTLVKCEHCGLVQLTHSFSPDDMYRQYWYQSGLNNTMVSALRDVVERTLEQVKLTDDDTVVDIGCNDGTLLKIYADLGWSVRRIGIDPSLNLADSARKNCERFINDYFKTNDGEKKAKVITAIAMFYDLEDVRGFLGAVDSWLDDDGIFVVQMTDLYHMMRENAFDNIVHEHLEYWSLKSLVQNCLACGFDVFRVSDNDVNGGSLRAFICRKGKRAVGSSVGEYLKTESAWCDHGWGAFSTNVNRCLSSMRSMLLTAHQVGLPVIGVGASTKGNTLLQLIGASQKNVACIGEVSPDKFGRYTVGTGIPIVPESEALVDGKKGIALVLPWHFINSIKPKIPGSYWTAVPMPVPKLEGEILW